jgi:hypothetical protein
LSISIFFFCRICSGIRFDAFAICLGLKFLTGSPFDVFPDTLHISVTLFMFAVPWNLLDRAGGWECRLLPARGGRWTHPRRNVPRFGWSSTLDLRTIRALCQSGAERVFQT